MRKFDVDAISAGLTQYWSSLSYSSNTISPQVSGTGVSGIVFTSDHLVNNRNICKGATRSVALNSDPGTVTSTSPVSDFSISFLIQADTSNLWLMKIALPSFDIGIRIKDDTSIELVWTADTITIDEDGNYVTDTSLQTAALVYSEDSTFVSLTRVGGTASMSVNGKVVTIEGNSFTFDSFTLGGGTGSALVDKVAYSTQGVQIKVKDYQRLFKAQRLDTVPRPEGFTAFNYLLDSSIPDVEFYVRSDFSQMDDYQYLSYYNPFESGVIRVDKRATFLIEYTVDQGVTWLPLPTKLKLDTYYSNVILRHQDTSDEAFYVQIVNTNTVHIPISFYDALITGEVYLPSEVGFGYYDADPGDFADATVRLTSNEGAAIRTLEMLAIINSPTGVIVTDTGVPAGTWYVNGVPGTLAALKPNQMYHLVFVSSANMPWVEIAEGHQVELVGLGASDVPYTQSDAYYIFNTFAGNPLITTLEDVDVLVDGISDSGEAASLLDLQWNK